MFRLARTLSELFAKFGNLLVRRRPVRIACIAVEYERARFQLCLEFFPVERNRLLVVVRTYDLEIHAVAHEPPS